MIRELLPAGGALAFGAYDGAASVIGLLVSIAAIGWEFYHHEGPQIISTSIRKALSLVPGVLLVFGGIGPRGPLEEDGESTCEMLARYPIKK